VDRRFRKIFAGRAADKGNRNPHEGQKQTPEADLAVFPPSLGRFARYRRSFFWAELA
jgi:hypothetical protein